ncbi:L10-interacting MYB domain-containing protein [Pyrus x bretschneideri]|nr:L10-interacting MYB domain-containing protein [Pyrus x bretschneideri]XP_048436093.1 L10-interacting MYB domain-containing protein [Pyrus x bretschneideri]
MGTRARTGGDRLRTVWTPEMDRYFIDLMLEQVGRGNKFDDHLFSKRAWKHMTSLFNTKFNFPYEKDVLKNRHKTLRNLYKAVKILLHQRGFSWDETRQMVTADNNAWDGYIKVHPDARSFRIKTIPYYRDLCLIYGDAAFEEKGDNVPEESSHSSETGKTAATQLTNINQDTAEALRDIIVGEDYGVTISEKCFDVRQHAITSVPEITASNRSRTYWQPPMDCYFIDLLQEQVQKGSRVDGVFRKQAWKEMIALFNTKFGFNYDMDVLKNRHKTLKRQYNVIKNLLELDGFSWDDKRHMVTADDYVWQDYIKEHTDARQFMTRPVPYYKDLCMICDPSLDDRDCYSGQDVEQQNQVEGARFCGALTSLQSASTSVSAEDDVVEVQESSLMSHKKRRQLENSSNQAHPKRSREADGGMASALREMASAVSSLSDKTRNDGNMNSGSIESVIEAIQALPDMDEDLVLDACDLLEDENKAKTFMALDVKLRKKWLTRKLRPQLAT